MGLSMNDGLVIVILLCGMGGLFWSAHVYDAARKRYKAQLDVADELQRRSNKLLEREEAIILRAEVLLERLENRSE